MPIRADEQDPSVRTLSLRAQAKVNLGLRVVGVRDDGYHLLESIFVPIDWSDDLHLRWDPDGEHSVSLQMDLADDALGVTAGAVPAGPDNLVYRAAERFLEAAGRTGQLSIALEKRLPAGAGLGGGSSDAGSVLAGLHELLPGALTPTGLARIALEIGADVPFFLDPRPAFVAGIGERIEPLDRMPALHLVLANPGIALSTPAVFGAWDAISDAAPGEAMSAVRSALDDWLTTASGDRDVATGHLERLLENDLRAAAVRLCPPVGRLLRRLDSLGARASGMSGSGATVFGVFETESDAQRVADQLEREEAGWSRVVVTNAAG